MGTRTDGPSPSRPVAARSIWARVPAGCRIGAHELPEEVDTVVLGFASPWSTDDPGGRCLEVTGVAMIKSVWLAA